MRTPPPLLTAAPLAPRHDDPTGAGTSPGPRDVVNLRPSVALDEPQLRPALLGADDRPGGLAGRRDARWLKGVPDSVKATIEDAQS